MEVGLPALVEMELDQGRSANHGSQRVRIPAPVVQRSAQTPVRPHHPALSQMGPAPLGPAPPSTAPLHGDHSKGTICDRRACCLLRLSTSNQSVRGA